MRSGKTRLGTLEVGYVTVSPKDSVDKQRVHEQMKVTGFSHVVFAGTLDVPCILQDII
jgi:hypothetical protein